VADHRGVYSFFPDFGLVAYASEGKERWRLPLPPAESMHGVSASPVLHRETLVLVCDHANGSFILAIDTKTGRQRWRKPRPDSVSGLYASPAIYAPKGVEPQVVVLGDSEVASYSIDSGDRLWWLPGLPVQMKSSPVVSGDVVYLACRQLGEGIAIPPFDQVIQTDKNANGTLEKPETAGPVNANFDYIDISRDGSINRAEWNELKRVFEISGAALAVRPNARGELSPKSVLWRVDKGLPEVPTPLYYQGVVFLLRNGGILTAIDGTTGAVTKQGRINVGGGAYYASPIAAGHLYLASESGRVSIVKAAPEWEPVADIDLNEEIYATPAVVNGNLYVRTMSSLYCFARP
jgi:outer membrane protein assembly factor BamB